MQIATLNNLSPTNVLTVLDINNSVYNIPVSSSVTIPASQINYANVYSALSNGTLTINNWSLPDVIVTKNGIPTRVQILENTAAGWTTSNTVLAPGFIGLESDTLNVKIGDGRTAWTSLGYYSLGYYGLFPAGSASVILNGLTTTATAKVLTVDGNAVAVNNQLIVPNNSITGFTGKVTARDTLTGNTSYWTFSGAVKKGTTAASTALVGAVTPTMVAQDSGASTWAVAVAADTTNGTVKVTFTGAASTNIVTAAKLDVLSNLA